MDRRIKHGLAHKHPNYDIWVGMRQRCNDPKHQRFENYGGKGIAVCKDWDSFEQFVRDMGIRPAGMSIERIDNQKGYSKENCKWATSAEQSRNRSMTVWIEFNGEILCVSDWAKKVGITFSSMKERLQKWSLEKALTTPKIINKGTKNG